MRRPRTDLLEARRIAYTEMMELIRFDLSRDDVSESGVSLSPT
jgi:hypothetical protein